LGVAWRGSEGGQDCGSEQVAGGTHRGHLLGVSVIEGREQTFKPCSRAAAELLRRGVSVPDAGNLSTGKGAIGDEDGKRWGR